MNYNYISPEISIFRGRKAPEKATLAGYGVILEAYNLDVPVPEILSLVSSKKRKYKIEHWQVFTPKYLPENNLYKQLVFALKYEGVNLLVLKKLFENYKQALSSIDSTEFTNYTEVTTTIIEWVDMKLK